MLSRFRTSQRHLLSPLAWRIRIAFWGSALLVGAVGVGFALSADYANALHHRLLGELPWLTMAATPVGLAALVWLTERYFRAASGSGIPQAIAALQVNATHPLRRSLLSLRTALAKVVLTFFALALGLSVGREGPTIHVGASVMHSLGRLARFPAHYLDKGLILAGSAAGLSAAFNAPLAGVVFAIEELHRSYEEYTSGIVLTAVIFGGLTSLVFLGNYAYFGGVNHSLPMGESWAVVPICGLIGGLVGGGFSLALIKGAQRLAPIRRAGPLRFGFICGVIIVVLGLLSSGHSYGTGYDEARALLGNGQGEWVDYQSSWYSPLLKILATLVSYFSGVPGGLFSPSLSAGAELGGFLGNLFPLAPHAIIALLGMAAYFTGVTQTPITTFVIVIEMTDNNDLVLPLMATTLIAHAVSRVISPEPLYNCLAQSFLTPAEPAASGDEKGTGQPKAADTPTGDGARPGGTV